MGRGGESGDHRRSRERRSTLVFSGPSKTKEKEKREEEAAGGDLSVFYANHMLI